MGIKALAARLFAALQVRRLKKWRNNPLEFQKLAFKELLANVSQTAFGKDHLIDPSLNLADWQMRVPLRDYEGLKPYIDRIVAGEPDVLWPGKPIYLCKTSGTTSGVKYIPMTRAGIDAQILAARNSLLCYIHETGNSHFTEGKMIFLQGSPVLEALNGMKLGRLSGMVAHHVPAYLLSNRMPSWDTNCIEDWEKKIDAIVEETMHQDMRLVSGIPPWVQMYFERLLKRTGSPDVLSVFPNLSVFAHGGVNYAPYQASMEKLLGGRIDTIETYPASEGFIAFQDTQNEEGLLLNLQAGIFYEFVPMSEYYSSQPRRIALGEVEKGVNYAIVLNTTSGLCGYLIGDTVKFTSLAPYRIQVTGRVKHFISAFGEHVIAEEVERAMSETISKLGCSVNEFHVAPMVDPPEGLPYHEWLVEAEGNLPEEFAEVLDENMRALNAYYNDLISGNVLRKLVLVRLHPGAFNAYMSSVGKLGGQNKLPRLSNDRHIADRLK